MDTIDGMRAFIAVADMGSFTAAAEREGMSTALASKYVGRLEQKLGARLFNRTTRSLALTEIGRAYLERARQIVEDLEALEASVQDQAASPLGHLIVSAPVTFGEMFLTDMVMRFLERHPKISVDLRLTDRIVGLAEEGVDLAIRISELEESSLIARKIAPIRVILCATPEYLRRHGTPVDPAELAAHSCVIDTNFRAQNEWPFLAAGKRKTVRVQGRFSANSARAARDVVLSDAGIGLIPSYAVAKDLDAGRLVEVLVEAEALSLNVYAVYLPNRHLAPKVRRFIDFLAENFTGADRTA